MTLFQGKDLSDFYGVDKLPDLAMVMMNEVPMYPSMKDVLFNTVTIQNTDQYQATTLSGIPGPVVRGLGQTPEFSTIQSGYSTTITTVDRSRGFAIAKETIDQGKFDLVKRAHEFFTKGAAEEKEYNLASIFDNAFTTTLADGQVLISANHPLEGVPGSVNSNIGTAAAFTKTSFKALRNVMQNQVDEQGNKLNPTAAHLLFPQALQDSVQEVLGSMYDPDNANNTINTMYGFTNVLPNGVGYWPHLSTTTSYFMMMKKEHTGLTYVESEGYSVVYDYQPHERIHTYSSHELYGIGVPSHRGIVGNAGA